MNLIDIPKGWIITTLNDTIYFKDIIGGGTPPRQNSEYFRGGIPWIRLRDMKMRYITETEETLTEVGLKKSSAKLLPINSVILSTRATIGEVAIAKTILTTNQGFKSIICNEEQVLPEFLYYYLKSIKPILESKSKSTTYAEINRTTLSNIQIAIPSIEIQKKIVQKLDYIFQKIEDKTKILQNVQENQIKRITLIKKRISSQIITNIFNDIYSSKNISLSEMIHKTETYNPYSEPSKKIKYIELGSIDSDSKAIKSFQVILGKNAPSRARKIIRTDDVIYATVRPYYRNVAIIPNEFDKEICSTGFCVLRTKKELLPKYLFYYLQSDQAVKQILKGIRGGNYPAVTDKDIKNISIPFLCYNEQELIVKDLDVVFNKIKNIKLLLNHFHINGKGFFHDFEKIYMSILDKAFSGNLVDC